MGNNPFKRPYYVREKSPRHGPHNPLTTWRIVKNMVPFWVPITIRGLIRGLILGTQKGTIILTIPHIPQLSPTPEALNSWCFSGTAVVSLHSRALPNYSSQLYFRELSFPNLSLNPKP